MKSEGEGDPRMDMKMDQRPATSFKFAVVRSSSGVGRKVIATEDMLPGEMLFQERAVVWVHSEIVRAVVCSNCGSDSVVHIGCELCCRNYCSESCKSADSEAHAALCSVFARIDDLCSLHVVDAELLRATLELAVRSSKQIQPSIRVLSDELDPTIRLPFSDAVSLFAHSTCFPAEWTMCVSAAVSDVIASAPEYFARHGMAVGDLVGFAQRINSNAHWVFTGDSRSGFGLFPLVAMLNHSCHPNCAYSGMGDSVTTLQVRVVGPVKQGEELCVRYADLYKSRSARQAELLESRYFRCVCERCRTYEHERELAGQRCGVNGCKGYVYARPRDQRPCANEEPFNPVEISRWCASDGIPTCAEAAAHAILTSNNSEAEHVDDSVISCDTCGNEFDRSSARTSLADTLQRSIYTFESDPNEEALVALVTSIEQAKSELHSMHELLLKANMAVFNSKPQGPPTSSSLDAHIAFGERAAMCLCSNIMPHRSVEAASVLSSVAQLYFRKAVEESRKSKQSHTQNQGATVTAALRAAQRAHKLQSMAVEHFEVCLGPEHRLVKTQQDRLHRISVALERISGVRDST